jgi:hypothetical protein
MDVAIIKTKEEFVAFSLFPVGIVGWGKSKSSAINSINDNVYDYCNWLLKPLPKTHDASVKEEYSGEIGKTNFKSDDKSLVKKYAEVVVQTAFSFKCMLDSFELSECEKELVSGVYTRLNIAGGGVIGYASDLSETGDLPKCRAFIYNVYKAAKEIFFLAKERGVTPTDCFKFDI